MVNCEKPNSALCRQWHEKKPTKLHVVGILIGGHDWGLPWGGQRVMEDSERDPNQVGDVHNCCWLCRNHKYLVVGKGQVWGGQFICNVTQVNILYNVTCIFLSNTCGKQKFVL